MQNSQTTTFAQAPQDPKKRHACPTCGRAFTTSGHLARHIRVHTGERNHKCPFPGCETRCSRQDNLQQHYRIHLSPGSRRSSSTRARAEAKKKTSLSSSTLPMSPIPAPRSSLLHDEPPDSPPPLARATALPSLHHRNSYSNGTSMMNHERSDQIPNENNNQGRSNSSASISASASASGSGSSAGSPHSYASATASPEISPHIPPTSTTGATTSGTPYGNLLGLSHERHHSPGSGNYNPYNSSYPHTTSNGHVYPHHPHHAPHRQMSAENYAMSSSSSPYPNGASQPGAPSSFAHTLPPIQSLNNTDSNSSYSVGRISQQPSGSYPSYETYAPASNNHTASNWTAQESSYPHHHHPQHSHQTHHNAWWSQNNVNVGVSVGAGTQRGYQSYATS